MAGGCRTGRGKDGKEREEKQCGGCRGEKYLKLGRSNATEKFCKSKMVHERPIREKKSRVGKKPGL